MWSLADKTREQDTPYSSSYWEVWSAEVMAISCCSSVETYGGACELEES
jgi:hypothetical protein